MLHAQIKAFGNHLGADQHIGFVAQELLQHGVMRVLAPHRITIPTHHAGRREGLLDMLLDALRTHPKTLDARAEALRTDRGLGATLVAGMANQGGVGLVVLIAGVMHREASVTARTAQHMPAVAA